MLIVLSLLDGCGGHFINVRQYAAIPVCIGGSMAASLPALSAPCQNEADSLGFTYAHGDKHHWSSCDTTKEVSVSSCL